MGVSSVAEAGLAQQALFSVEGIPRFVDPFGKCGLIKDHQKTLPASVSTGACKSLGPTEEAGFQ